MLEEHRPLPRTHDVIVTVERGGILPAETCEGPDYTPEVWIEGLWAPYFALIMDDPSASAGGFTHWILWNVEAVPVVPRNIPKSMELTSPIIARQGRNSLGKIGYSGPCPPEGEEHTYSIRIYGLDEPLDLNPGSTRDWLERKMDGHIVQYGQADIHYQRTSQ